jgi:hypothetical protein
MNIPTELATARRRPSRIPQWVLVLGLTLLGLSFVSGVVIWWGQVAQAHFDVESPRHFQIKVWVKLHGALNPFLCGLLGYLSHQHIRLGWQMRANRPSGVAMFLVFGALVITGTALYYSGGETMRQVLVWLHRVLGLLLPMTLAAHWIGAWRWVKNRERSGP